MVKVYQLSKQMRRFRSKAKPKAKRGAARKASRRPRTAGPSKMVISQPGSQTQSKFAYGSGKVRLRKGLDALGVPSYYVFNKTYVIQPPGGTQAAAIVGLWNSVPDMNNMGDEVSATMSHPTAILTPTRFCVRSLKAEVMFANSTNVSCVMDIYDIACKRDIPLKAVTMPMDVSSPLSAWIEGETQQVTNPAFITPFVNAAGVPGSIPQDSQLFKDYYRIVSKKSVALAAGASHQHHVHLKHPRLLDLNETASEVSYLVGVQGITFFTMVVIRGQISSSAGPGGSNPSQNATVLIRAVTTERYEYQWIAVNGSSTTYSSNLPAPGTAGVAMVDSSFAPASIVSA